MSNKKKPQKSKSLQNLEAKIMRENLKEAKNNRYIAEVHAWRLKNLNDVLVPIFNKKPSYIA